MLSTFQLLQFIIVLQLVEDAQSVATIHVPSDRGDGDLTEA